MNFELELPLVLAYKVSRIMKEKKCTFEEAVFYLVEKVCTPLAK